MYWYGLSAARHLLDDLSVKEFAVCVFRTLDPICAIGSPLLEEESGVLRTCLSIEATHLVGIHRACNRSAFATDNHPIDVGEVHLAKVFE